MVRKTYTLHLAKADTVEFEDVLSSAAKEKLGTPVGQSIVDRAFGQGAVLYVFVAPENSPKWLRELRLRFDVAGRIQTSSACAALVF